MKKLLTEGNQIYNFTLSLWELLWFHFITVPDPVPLRSVIKLRLRFRYGKVKVPTVPVPQHSHESEKIVTDKKIS